MESGDKVKITDKEKEELFGINREVENQLSNIIIYLDDTIDVLDNSSISSYYINSIRERISEAKERINMANIRNEEFLSEIENGNISTRGFY